MIHLTAFAAAYVFIFLRAFQQLNVVRGNKVLIVPTSVGMAACEVYTIGAVVLNGWGWIVVTIGVGSGLGAICAMWVHKRFVERKESEE
jgi:anaerobic glycerol-3-phosphate dehydrogenase